MKKNNYKVYYATSENCFEGEKIADGISRETAIEILESNIADDIDYEGLTQDELNAERDSIVAEAMSSGWVLFENSHKYEALYIVTTNGRDARRRINGFRREILRQMQNKFGN